MDNTFIHIFTFVCHWSAYFNILRITLPVNAIILGNLYAVLVEVKEDDIVLQYIHQKNS